MKRAVCLFLCMVLFIGTIAINASAAVFQVSCYNEEIYAGGIVDLYAFAEGGKEPYTYQWQAEGYGWIDLEDNDVYRGTKTNHMQLYTKTGDYGDIGQIPFQCVVTDGTGEVRYTPEIHVQIYPTANLIPNLQKWGYELYEPTVSNLSGLQTSDYVNYRASTYAGSKVGLAVGGKTIDRAVLNNSEVKLTREIHITENGHTTKVGDKTTYIPYTVGNNAVTVEMKLHLTIGQYDLGDIDTKTIMITTTKPTAVSTASTTAACSLLRYTYNESQKLASLPKGTSVEVLGKEGSFYQVYYNGFVGYVGTSLLNVQQEGNASVIKNVDLTITAPVAGQTPQFTCQLSTKGCKLYKTDPITWTDKQTGKTMGVNDRFVEGRSYSVSIWVAADTGYKFQTDASYKPKLTGSINGNLPPYIYKAYEQDPEQVVELSYTFVAKKAAENSVPTHTHTYTEWQYNFGQHYKHCTGCDEIFFLEGHKGGTATCTQKAQCAVCGYRYGAEPDHKWSPKYHPVNATGHAYQCADCKGYDTVIPHTPGKAATETTPQTCTDCGYIIEPARNHKHSLTKISGVAATCTEGGTVEHYTCSGCAKKFTDPEGKNEIPDTVSVTEGALGHQIDENWKYDLENHWRICSVCKTVLEETKMAHTIEGADCLTCGYCTDYPIPMDTEPAATENEETAEPTEPPTDKPDNSWIWLVVVAVAGLGGGALAAVLIHLRKKKEETE